MLGHSDVAPARKADPGELFPWARLAEYGIGVWPGMAAASPGKPEEFAANLVRYGYDPDLAASDVVAAFQRHFRPSCVNGIADDECAALLAGLPAL